MLIYEKLFQTSCKLLISSIYFVNVEIHFKTSLLHNVLNSLLIGSSVSQWLFNVPAL